MALLDKNSGFLFRQNFIQTFDITVCPDVDGFSKYPHSIQNQKDLIKFKFPQSVEDLITKSSTSFCKNDLLDAITELRKKLKDQLNSYQKSSAVFKNTIVFERKVKFIVYQFDLLRAKYMK